MTKQNHLTPASIGRLSLASHYWAMAMKHTCKESADSYYDKAYAILNQEIGSDNAITCELRKEMAAR